MDCGEWVEKLAQADSLGELRGLLDRIGGDYGFSSYTCAMIIPDSLTRPTTLLLTSMPDGWIRHYICNHYERIDPRLLHCAKHTTPTIWSSQRPQRDCSPRLKKYLCDSTDVGLIGGVVSPVRGVRGERLMLALNSDADSIHIRREQAYALPHVHLLGTHIHEALLRLHSPSYPLPDKKPLTDRERDCLLWSAEGKTAGDISGILNISERTAVFHLNNATTKLNAVSRQHAVAIAVVRELLPPVPDEREMSRVVPRFEVL